MNDPVEPAAVESDRGGLYDLFRSMTPVERRTFWACFSGWALDGLDFTIYPLVIATLMASWSVTAGTAGLVTTLALLASALGGWLVGNLSDRIGRVAALQITVAWFAVFTLLCGLAQNMGQLLVLRTLMGLGFGGEWAAGAVLMSETIRPQFRGRALGAVQSAWAVGWAAAVLMQGAIFLLLPPETGWRAMFVLGALPAIGLVLYIRKAAREPDIALRRRALTAAADRPKLWEIFAPEIRGTTLLASLAFTGAQGGYYAITSWIPTYLKKDRGLTIMDSAGYLAAVILGSFAGYLVGAWLCDRIGRRNLFLAFSLGSIAMVFIYTQAPVSGPGLLLAGALLGFSSSGYFSGAGAFLAELYPTRLRGAGQGFTYSCGRGLGALFPALIGYLSNLVPLGEAMTLFAVVAYAVFFLTAYALPETRGRVLEA